MTIGQPSVTVRGYTIIWRAAGALFGPPAAGDYQRRFFILSSQHTRLVHVDSPLGPKALQLQRLEGREELGRLFSHELELASSNPALSLDTLLGKPMSLTLELPGGSRRHFHSIVARCSQGAGADRLASYQVTLRPWLWLLTRTSDCHIFQNQKVPDIIKQVFRDLGFFNLKDALNRSYREWGYCVQYRETSFDSVSRLTEQEDTYYWFRHEKKRHILALFDAYGAYHSPVGYTSVPYYPPNLGHRERDHFFDWHMAREIQPSSLSLNDYDSQRPGIRLETRSNVGRAYIAADYLLYDYPDEYVQSQDGEHYARTRIEAIQTQYERVRLWGCARGIGVGHLFHLSNYPCLDQNREYLVAGVEYRVVQELYRTGNGGGGVQFESELDCIDVGQAFRPLLPTPVPVVRGPQTAVAVGPKDEETWTDQYGRVEVYFHWDRHGQFNENSSCWMRVSQVWAGKSWGSIQIPWIGQEVIVSFLEGDPDRPIITGRVYNAERTVSYELPVNATQSGTKSRSSKDGMPANFGEIRMEDKKGAEQLFIHTERNQDIEVGDDETHWVGHDRTKTIDHDETVHMKYDRTEIVDNNETITVYVSRSKMINHNETVRIGMNKTETILMASLQNVGVGRMENVGLSYSSNAGMVMNTAVGLSRSTRVMKKKTLSVDDSYEVSVGGSDGGSKITLDGQSITLGSQCIKLTTDCETPLRYGQSTIRLTPGEIEILSPNAGINC